MVSTGASAKLPKGDTCPAATFQRQHTTEMNPLTCAHTHTHRADTLTDGMKHWQRCERTASMKQMGAKCGNEEVKNTHTGIQ